MKITRWLVSRKDKRYHDAIFQNLIITLLMVYYELLWFIINLLILTIFSVHKSTLKSRLEVPEASEKICYINYE